MKKAYLLAVLVAVLGIAGTALGAASAPQRGFVSAKPAEIWEHALVSGNGKYGALVMGQPLDETIILNHARLFMPLNRPLPPVDTASHLKEIRKMFADGQYQRAADYVVELSHKENYGGKRWTDPFIPAFDLRLQMPARGQVKDYQRSVDFQTGVAAVRWQDDRGEFCRRLFVSRPDDVVVLSIAGPGSGMVDCELGARQAALRRGRRLVAGLEFQERHQGRVDCRRRRRVELSQQFPQDLAGKPAGLRRRGAGGGQGRQGRRRRQEDRRPRRG